MCEYNLAMLKDTTPLMLDDFFGKQRGKRAGLQQTNLEILFKENLVKSILEKFHRLLKHPQSQSLPENPYLDKSDNNRYIQEIGEYDEGQTAVDEYNQSHPDETKINFIEDGNCNIGWKVHINVHPKDVVFVSGYLKNNGYRHKFLHGGEIDSGKIFTIYIGDYTLARTLAKTLSSELKNYLCKPVVKNEIELAPGVVGRFVAPKHIVNDFHPYGSAGFSWKKEFQTELASLVIRKPPDYDEQIKNLRVRAENESFSALLFQFGSYFYDTENRL